MVPEFEEREAARFGLCTWSEWSALPREERVHGVAHYRLRRLIDLHVAEAAMRLTRQQS